VPLLIRWPGMTQPNSSCSTPVVSMDFYPTMLEMAGLPLREEQHKDGISLLPLLEGNDLQRAYLYWHFPHYQGEGAYPASAVRYRNYKLVRNFHFEDYRLFNVADDPYERCNLIEQEPELAQKLKTVLSEWFDEVGAELPLKNTDTAIIDEIKEDYRDK